MIGKLLDFVVGREPVATGAVVSAVLALVVAFGVDLSAEQTAAIAGAVTVVVAWFARKAVTPVAGPTEHQDRGEAGWAPILSIIVVAVAIILFFVACDVLWDDDDDPDDLGAPAWIMDDDRNRNGNDCNQSENCSDDDQVVIAPVICVEPGSCRF